MDCLEFQRLLGSDPHVSDVEARAHLAKCAACGAATAQAQAFEARITAALAVQVPHDLVDRILRAQRDVVSAPVPIRRRPYAWIGFAAAASLALAFGLVRYQQAHTMPALVAAHVTSPDEIEAWDMRDPVPAHDVEAAFADRGVHLASSPPADVAYVSECGIDHRRTVHMVMAEQGQPVSVVYVVQERGTASKDFHRDGLTGRAVPIKDGTLYMLARENTRFDSIEHAWRNAIEGPAQVAAGSP